MHATGSAQPPVRNSTRARGAGGYRGLSKEKPVTNTSPDTVDTFEQRWAQWQKKGAEHERISRRRMQVFVPILLAVVAAAALLIG
jgi:hypothetical protein